MKNSTIYIYILIISAISCTKPDEVVVKPIPDLGPVYEVQGTLSDYAAVDGCGLRLSIEQDSVTTNEYGISDQSAPLIQKYVTYTNAVAHLKATVRFQHTGQTKKVLCGFSGLKPFKEVVLLSIHPQ
ncbi:hypothetical protein [Spirosoma utsteinense]|uniref:Uncharacterized protein n=1 Tax=Spirosoma utsteinense TaxID=2585773 RepID=A0ABR6W407_9BACT|nr:hypothetical protein [Spirosoma utsteinense]MBC3784249.1 hypothetical protein [Spirosoma utsteinense]MBC3790954.1 hypothetical protein [Spirosoma utsteinense]